MRSHLELMVIFAGCVAAVFATLVRDDGREQVRLAARIFGGLVVGAYLLGWVLYGLFG